MRPIDRFSLERHEGPYESWPLRTRLSCAGERTALELAGYDLRWQFELDIGYLLITDHDCPFEEIYEIYLLGRDLRLRSHHSDPSPANVLFGAMAGAIGLSSKNLYCSAEVLDARRVRLLGCTKPPHLEIAVLDKRPYAVGRLLRVRYRD